MERPTVERLPRELACAAREVATTLARAGHRAWLVGGAVRDLALGVEPADVDLASAARPDEIERLFTATYAVGRAFGTVVVRAGTQDVQLTTFRAESGYDDARRPTHVRFAETLEEDAARRDFTCNALYLDPLDDDFRDPTGGLADLAAGRLRCVGDPAERFTEDGLRLLRLARLAAQHGLAPDPATRAGAGRALDALRGLSAERIFEELARMAEGRAPGRAVGLLDELGVLARLPGLDSADLADRGERVRALARLAGVDRVRFFGLLFRPKDRAHLSAALAAFVELRPPRALQARVQQAVELEEELGAVLALVERRAAPRSRWIRLARSAVFVDAVALWRAWHGSARTAELERLLADAAALAPAELRPVPLVTSAELDRAGIPRGPRWTELLRAAEDAQLDGELRTLEDARAWVAARRG